MRGNQAESDGQPLSDLDGAKVQKLYAFLLLHRDRPHSRVSLASLLWGEMPEAHARQYLRKALWQLGAALEGAAVSLIVEPGWIQFAPAAGHWLDVAQFETAYARVEDIPGQKLKPAPAAELSAAVALYRGDLLEGWYQEWCLFERERLERMYLIMLEKLMLYCESQGQYEAGIAYGIAALRRDRARERTHRRLIRLHYLSGDRSEALRQYQRCLQALQEELGVGPRRPGAGSAVGAAARRPRSGTAGHLAAAIYFPRVRTTNPLLGVVETTPPAGLVAGAYARTLRGADVLADECKYVPIRRLALFIEESLYRGTQWVVFELNDEPLWSQIRRWLVDCRRCFGPLATNECAPD